VLYLMELLYISIPIASVVFFVWSLRRYLEAKRLNREEPDTVTADEVRKRKVILVESAVIMGVILSVVIGFVALLFLAIAYM